MRKPAMKDTQQSVKSTTGKASQGFTDEARAAIRERAQEQKAGARRGPRGGKADGESDVLAKIAEMPEPDRVMAERLHALVHASAPDLSPNTVYGARCASRDAGTGSRHGRAAPCARQGQRARSLAENLVRDARVRQGRQGRLL